MSLGVAIVEIKADLRGFEGSVKKTVASSVKGVGRTAGERLGTDMRAGFGAKLGGVGAGIWGSLGTMLGVGIASVIPAAVKMNAEFDASIARIQTLTGLSQQDMPQIRQGILDLAGAVGIGPTSLAESFYHVSSNLAGVTPQMMGLTTAAEKNKAMLDATAIAAKGAQIGHADLIQTTNALGAVIANGTVGVGHYNDAMGVLIKIVGAGDMTMDDMAKAMGTGVLAVTKNYGISLQDTGAALARFGDNNIRGAKAGTAFTMMIRSMGSDTSRTVKHLAEIGIGQGQLANDMRTGGLIKATTDLKTHLDAAGISGDKLGSYLTNTFTSRAGPGLAILLSQFDAFKGKFGEMNSAGSDFAAAWAARQQTLSQKFDDLKARGQAWMIELGDKLKGPVGKALDGVTHVLDYIANHKNARDILAGIALGAASMAAAITGISVVLAAVNPFTAMILGAGLVVGFIVWIIHGTGTLHDIIAPLAVAVGALVAGFMAFKGVIMVWELFKAAIFNARIAMVLFNMAMAANPIGFIVTAITLVVVALVYFFTQTKLGKKVFHEIVEAAKVAFDWLKHAVSEVGNWFAHAWQTVSHDAVKVWDWIKSAFMVGVRVVGRELQPLFTIFTFIFKGMVAYVQFVIKAWQLAFKVGFAILSAIFKIGIAVLYILFIPLYLAAKWAFDQIVAAAQWVFNNVLKPIFDWFVGIATETWHRVAAAAQWLWDLLVTGWNGFLLNVRAVWDWVKGIVEGFWNWIKPFVDANIAQLTWVWNHIVSVFESVWGGVKDKTQSAWDWITSLWNRAVDWFGNIGSQIGGKLGSMWDGVKNGGREAINAAIGIINRGIEVINSKLIGSANAIASKIPGMPTIDNIPPIPTLYKGTNSFVGGLALVGEDGPELVNMPRGSQVHTAGNTKAMLAQHSNTSHVTVNQNFYGPTTSSERLKELDWTLRYGVKGGKRMGIAG